MAEKEQEIKENYDKNLKAVLYHKELITSWETLEPVFKIIVEFIHRVAKSGRFAGTKLLEIGSGATVHSIAPASAVYTNIVQSDYVLDNCEELKRWHRGESPLDWSEFLNLTVRLEGYEDDLETGRKMLETRIRKSVKCVVRSDVLSDEVVSLDELTTPETRPPYDAVVSCLCLEAVAPDFDGYVTILKRINTLLRPGGGVIICGFENGGTWATGEYKFHHIKLSLRDIASALQLSGFGKVDLESVGKIRGNYFYEYDSAFCVAAEKL